MKAANLALKFLVELMAFAAFAFWGASTGQGVVAVVLALAAPLAAVALWGRFAAPKSPRRLPRVPRVAFELGVFALAAVALAVAGAGTAALTFAAIALANAVALEVLDQWDH